MSKYDVSDFDADELNQAIDDTNFPNSRRTSTASHNNNHENGENDDVDAVRRHTASSMPVNVKNGNFSKSFSDDVFDLPKTPRSIPRAGNCE